jgi:Tol biopolymer transport system component
MLRAMARSLSRRSMRLQIFLAALAIVSAGCSRRGAASASESRAARAAAEPLERPGERRLRNIRQLTFGGENAEAYFSFDGARLIFQSSREGRGCDQEYVMRLDGTAVQRVSTGAGAVTCGYFFPDGSKILYSSTHHVSADCPPRPSMEHGYAWPLHDFDIYVANRDGSDPRPLAPSPAYDAEATVSRDGWIVFTSTRDGDLELYKMRLDGSALTRLTHEPGYDGGAFFSADGRRIVYRASRPTTPAELADYESLLAKRLVRPVKLELWVMDADGSNAHQVTSFGAASFAPFFHPDGRRIIFASNLADPRGRNFDLYLVNDDGTGLERVTTDETFDGFPMFSPDGKKLVFASNRNASRPGETNVFIADWVE